MSEPVSIQPKLVERGQLNEEHFAQIGSLLDAVKRGEITAYAIFAIRPGFAMSIRRSRMNSRDRMEVIAQMEYAKFLMLKEDDEEHE